MNFAKTVKEEIANKIIKDRCCKRAFIAGVLRGNGTLYYTENGELGIQFYVYGEETAIKITEYFKSVFKYEIREVKEEGSRFTDKGKFTLSVSGDRAEEILRELEILKEENGEIQVNLKFYGGITEKDCCLRAFFKGLFLSVGNCTLPSNKNSGKTGYHLELCFSHYTPAIDTLNKLSECGVKTKITRRKSGYIVYIKSGEEIKNFIAFIGAGSSVLKLSDFLIEREIANASNRQNNCYYGNVNKQIDASIKQVKAIEKLQNSEIYSNLKEDLKKTAEYRIKYREDTLSELSERLNVSKSCLNHRLRKLVSLSEEI